MADRTTTIGEHSFVSHARGPRSFRAFLTLNAPLPASQLPAAMDLAAAAADVAADDLYLLRSPVGVVIGQLEDDPGLDADSTATDAGDPPHEPPQGIAVALDTMSRWVEQVTGFVDQLDGWVDGAARSPQETT